MHLLGVFDAAIRQRLGVGKDLLFLAQIHCGNQRSDPDADGAEVGDLVNFQERVELARIVEYFIYLVARYGVDAAPEGDELNEFKVVSLAHEFRGGIQPGMVDPLVDHAQGPLGLEVDRQAVLGEDGKVVRRDQFRDTVVDLRVDVVGHREDDSSLPARSIASSWRCLRRGVSFAFSCSA